MRDIYEITKITQEVINLHDAGIVRDLSESPDKVNSSPPTPQPAVQSDADLSQDEAAKVKQG